ncbi:hypothetical protein ABB37_01831 [Leptomonas pyrrhocoris]|uniref:Uncharacterized protein n=1 Tax=Leptomonas pyrrhocoris TaxID=157538 RepID=A0A0M9G9L5_LEPPY|nr:hypothetical protein ABB37_01831 [Leptomonas pyrrhocoris]KPA85567.1 hypothetical protein ABB37_01831 [Leptomonas pyrrhocoris]|eukprot:XP_015664006.1 hypothetical protein ABB37_01831 [Leptomonas pyrrhocoris]
MHFFKLSVPLACLIYHFILVTITQVNYVLFIRFQNTALELRQAYLAFSVIGIVAYGACAGPLFVYAYKYGSTWSLRLGRLLCGIAVMFVFSSLPMLIIELVQLLYFDGHFKHALDGMCFVLHLLAAGAGGCTSWFAYLRAAARCLQNWRGPERQIVDEAENIPTKEFQLKLVKRSQLQPQTI